MPIPSLGQELRIRQDPLSPDYYRSRVADITDAELFIDEPLHSKTFTSMQCEGEFWVEFYGHDGALCRFLTRRTTAMGELHSTWRLAIPKRSDVVREQRREFVRVFANLPVEIVTSQDARERRLEVHTRDISGGGLSVLLPRGAHLTTGHTVLARFMIPGNEYLVEVNCFVVRVSEPNDNGYSLASLKFMDIKEAVRQRVIRYTFERQRATM